MNGIESKAEKVSSNLYELDELYWFIEKKPRTETRENTYVFTMVSRVPRQLIGFDVSMEKSSKYIQGIVNHAPDADFYCTDGYIGYLDVVYPGKHVRNLRDKSDTFTVWVSGFLLISSFGQSHHRADIDEKRETCYYKKETDSKAVSAPRKKRKRRIAPIGRCERTFAGKDLNYDHGFV